MTKAQGNSIVRPIIAIATVAAALLAAPAALASPGNLDPTFSGDGWQSLVPRPGTPATLDDAVSQPDGKLVVAGLAQAPDPVDGGEQTVGTVARYNLDGSIDTSFASGGVATIDLGGTHGCLPVSDWSCPAYLARQPDGKIVVAVNEAQGGGQGASSTVLARLEQDGSLDREFGSGGEKLVPSFATRGLALAPDGKIVLGGIVGGDAAVARYLADGTVDPVFGGGIPVATGNDRYLIGDVAVQGDGRIVTAGEECGLANRCAGDELAATRLVAGGAVDRSFSKNGQTTIKLWGHVHAAGANAVTIDKGGRIALGGYARTSSPGHSQVKLAIARLRADGRPDGSFAAGGRAAIGFGEPDAGGLDGIAGARSIVADGNELYAVGGVGRAFVDGAIAIVAYTPDHGIDRQFGSEGKARTTPPAGSEWDCAVGNAAAVAPAGRLAVAGYQYGCDEEESGYEGPPDAGAIAVYER